jgi:hypothetical protein
VRNLLPDLGGEGDSGERMTHGSVAGGILMSDLISKGYSPWTDVYDPSRKPLKAAATYLRENLTVAKNFAEYVAPGEISSWDELEPGQGAIVRHGLRKAR